MVGLVEPKNMAYPTMIKGALSVMYSARRLVFHER